MRISIFLIFLCASNFLVAQNTGPTRVTSLSDIETISQGSYNYSCNIKFRFQSAGYSDKPTAMKVGITDFYITKITYKGQDAAELLNNISYPIAVSQAQADVSGTIIMRRGNATWSTRFNIGSVRAGGLDNLDFTSSQREEIYSIFGQDVTYNDVEPEMPAVSLSDVIASRVRDITNDMDRAIREKESKRKEDYERERNERLEQEKEDKVNQKEKEEKEKEEDSEKTDMQNSLQEEEISEAQKAEEKRKEELAAQRAAQERREEAERKKQQRISDYNRRVESQRQENKAIASASAASSAALLFYVGGFVYRNMGKVPPAAIYRGNNGFMKIEYGFGLSSFPMAFASDSSTINGNGDVVNSTGGETRSAFTVDFNIGINAGYEMENFKGEGYVKFLPGFSPIFDSFNTSINAGANLYGGVNWVKGHIGYEVGTHSYSKSDFLDPEEFGSGKTSTNYSRMRYGASFSFYGNARSARRHHITLGFMEEYIEPDGAEIIAGRSEPDTPIIGIFNTDENDVAVGYFAEWEQDMTSKLYIRIFPNYPVTGEEGGASEVDDQLFLQVGFIRNFGAFFNKK